MRVALVIEETLLRLHAIMDRLSEPQPLSGEDIAELVQAWDVDMGSLESHVDRFPESITSGDGTREKIVEFVHRIAEVQPILVRHKSEIAEQLFSENRRVQSMRSGYGAAIRGSGMLNHKA
ncbi:MAG: hypothetical protein HQL94_03455 [Magnetococcales bacterium]|nr:hypothetical protein [Magnetococcales bacterium]MBF0438454.1 hypothetical protein [Magnetococcales bacterium]